MKVVYNTQYGGFSLSEKAIARYWELKGEAMPDEWSDHIVDRTDPILVQVVQELGAEAAGRYATLAIRDVPAGSLWRIDEYDGNELVMTVGDYLWQIARED